jgi:SAM-dependent methyltransferase
MARMTEDLYGPGYFSGHAYGVDPLRARAYELERFEITRRVPSGRIFDYGCGTGDFLAGFDDHWQRFGWDISDYARRQAQDKGIKVYRPDILPDASLSVVVFRGTLQHIDNPVGALKFARRTLKPGGLLAILATPNTESLCYQLFKTLPALDAPRNFFIPGQHELANVLRNVGFSQIETRQPYWDSPYARPAHDFAAFAMALLGRRPRFAFPGNMLEMYAR